MKTKDLNLDDLTSFKKHTEMVVMKPRQGRVTLIGRRLYYILLAFAQSKMDGAPMLNTELFSAPLRDLLKVGDSDGDEISAAKKYLKEMLDFKVDWESTDQGDGVKWTGVSMLSEVSLAVVNGQNWVSWAFPPTIIKMILQPERYSKLNLKIVTSISTYQGTALYDICSRYRDNPTGVTSRKSVDWWIDALSQSASAQGKRREWRKFKAEKLADAIDEINEDTDISIELIEHRVGRTITEAQFSVKKKQLKSTVGKTTPIDVKKLNEVAKQAYAHGISLSRLESLIRTYGEDLVNAKLAQLEQRIIDPVREKIEDKYAYLRAILASHENANLVEQQQVKSESVEDSTGHLDIASLLGVSNSKKPGADTKFNSLTSIDSDSISKSMQISNTRDEINALDEKERAEWIEKGIQSLRARNLCSQRDLKQAESGWVVSGTLGAEIVDIYTKSKSLMNSEA
ncbi:MAG: RepB family plasmid replication initiator protein [Rhodoferax sp.]|nr:RepB family plasmid replication initiator protein [Rhodoferax sp.]